MVTRQTTALPCEQFEVGDGNWNTARGPIHSIVLHTMVGTVAGADARFNTPNSQVSAHYGVGLDGKLYQWVDEDNVAFHAGDWIVNQTSIGIEHEDGTNPQTNPTAYNNPRPDALYETSAKIVADICRFYDFPADAEHIFRHHDVIDKTVYPGGTACPDALDTDRIISMAAAILNPPKPVPPVETPVVTVPTEPLPVVEPTISVPPVIVETPVVVQPEPAEEINTPIQSDSTPPEASFEASGQAGKVPFSVETSIIPPQQSKPSLQDWIVRLIFYILSLIGIEKGEE